MPQDEKQDPDRDLKQDPSKALELAHLYERAPIALCVTDRDHRYVRINQRLCDINGSSMEEHLGRTVQDVIPHLADQIVPMFSGCDRYRGACAGLRGPW